MQRVLSKQDYNVKLDLSIIEKHVKTNESSSVTPGTGPQNATANRGKMINILATKKLVVFVSFKAAYCLASNSLFYDSKLKPSTSSPLVLLFPWLLLTNNQSL